MKKCLFILFVAPILLSIKTYSQDNPPAPYEVEEENPVDLAPEQEPVRKKTPPPAPAAPPAAAPATEQKASVKKPTEQPVEQQKVQVEQKAPVALPSQPQAPKLEEKKVEIPVPSNVPVLKVSPETPTQPVLPAQPAPPDAGPLRDAGENPSQALPVTYALYESNSLSPSDTTDVFQFYARAKEGIGVILKPLHPSSKLSCEILGESGEVLSQTEAINSGELLAFQISPFEENKTIYFRIKDKNLLPESPLSEQRQYSFELKPIATLTPTPAPPASPQAASTPSQPPVPSASAPQPPESKPTRQEKQEGHGTLYGLIGVGVLGVLLALMIFIRKRRKQ